MKKLTALEMAWAEAALGAIFPGSHDAGLAGIGGMDVRGYLAEVCWRLPLKAVVGLRLAIWIVALAPLFVVARFATIRSLAQPDRERVVAVLVAHPAYALRSLVLILKTIGALLYAGDERVRARMLAVRPRPKATSPVRLVTLRLRGPHAA
jgi:hypothetical protein